uniref:Outer dense fiber of sperm tails 3 like 2 n=1 Tax=Ornithorhynchus anatinus TaxID=9258 RepID=F7D879_ORNAN
MPLLPALPLIHVPVHIPGPGPGRYNLPSTIGYVNHDWTKWASPAYSFHRRFSNASRWDSSPGPCYFVEPQITRFGRSRGPAYSMLARAKPRGLEQTPGAGSYSPEKVAPATWPTPPSFTMGSRTRYHQVDPVPAPNSYTLPALLGSRLATKPSSPSYTVSGRTPKGSFSEDLSRSPGPGRYNSTDPNTYLRRRPAFSMLGRRSISPAVFQSPGPGAHSPERVTVHRARAPAYSLGIRHSEFITPLIVEVSP